MTSEHKCEDVTTASAIGFFRPSEHLSILKNGTYSAISIDFFKMFLVNCIILHLMGWNLSLFFSLYSARPSLEYYQQVYFVHSGLQDESLQVTISKLP